MEQLFKFISNLNAAQRAVIIGGFSLLFVFLIGLLVYSGMKAEDKKLNYIIATNLTKSQVMLASNELEAAGISFLVTGSGNNLTLKTSKEFINIAKIKLVTSEASTNRHVGWEIFEKSSLGTTNFENKVKYLRALEGELARTLESLSGVLRANIKIAIPKDTIFTEKKVPPTASAMLSLRPGVFLTKKQIDGIKNFIASAVPSLKVDNIQLIDQDGSLLELNEDEINNQKSYTQNRYKEKLEKEYENKIVALLEPFVGNNRVVAKVNLLLDFVSKDIQEEIYDPEGTIRSQQVIENTSSSQGVSKGAGGVAGVDNNIQEPSNANGDSNSSSSKEGSNTVTNYEISKKIIKQKDNNYTNIKKASAAVTFDSKVLENIDNKDEFIQSLESIIQEAIGYDKLRGDKVTVKSFKFLNNKNLTTKVDKDGNVITVDSNNVDSVDTVAQVKSFLSELSQYIQYVIVAILIFVFYKKFIANNDMAVLNGSGTIKSQNGEDISSEDLMKDMMGSLDDDFDVSTARGRLKSKIKSQLFNNIEGLDEEAAAKYEVLIEELDKEVNTNPTEIAKMIELLLTEGNKNFK